MRTHDLATAPPVLPFLQSGFFQVCYVTSDLDAGMRQLASRHGVERFRVRRDVASLPGMPAMTLHQAHVYLGDVQVELIQPAGGDDSIYRDVCPVDGALRHHHYGLWVDERAGYESLRERCAALGVRIAMEIAVPAVGGAIYADFRRELGHYIEYVHLAPEVKAGYYADVPRY